jgi:CDGSH-type Zn-finger protein
MTDAAKGITVLKNGPYLVTGDVPLEMQTIEPDAEGSWDWAQGRAFEASPPYALCRCGESKAKPFCDGTHAKIGFDGTETASREPFAAQAKTSEGPVLVLDDAEALCSVARFCDNHGRIWNLIADTDNPATRATVEHQATYCPSGRLVVRDRATGTAIEPELPQTIGVVEDPGLKCSGPLWVRGRIAITSADGFTYEVRNRVTLCRCGRSQNKPFCDGAHTEGDVFVDGLA